MRSTLVIATVLALVSLSAVLVAQEQTSPPSSAPAAAVTPDTKPAGPPRVLAVVGGTEITSAKLDAVLSRYKNIPPDKMEMVRKQLFDGLIAEAMVHKFLARENIQCTPDELAVFCKEKLGPYAQKEGVTVEKFMKEQRIDEESLRDQICLGKIIKAAVTDEKVNAFIKNNPDYFNGTKVRASHILINCPPMAATDKQQAAREKLQKIADDLQSGKIKSFEDAAKEFSDCPSKAEGGDLKDFTFEKMVPPFAIVAFGMKKGQVSGIIRSEFGFHLIKVMDREQGKDEPSPDARQIARQVLQKNAIEAPVMEMALKDCPIVIR